MSAGAFERLGAVISTHGFPFTTARPDDEAMRGAEALGLPASFLALYAEAEPASPARVPWVVEKLRLFSLAELPGAQDGYATEGPSRVPSPAWIPTWVVVASISGDPFFVDVAADPCPVFFAWHGEGTWTPRPVASSMQSFIEALIVFEEILLGVFDREIFGEDGITPHFTDLLRERLDGLLPEAGLANFLEILQ